MSQAITSYLQGATNQNEFREKLRYTEVPIDDKLEGMIRRQECGDSVSYNTMGTHIFRQLNGTETYNRVDKVNMNNVAVVAPEKSGEKFASTQLGPRKKKQTDALQMEEETRHVTGNYVPRKGGTKARNDAFASNLFNVLDMDRGKQTGAERAYIREFKPKNISILQGEKNLLSWDETNYNSKPTHSRKQMSNHACLQDSGNLW